MPADRGGLLGRIAAALHPLPTLPATPPRNLAELADLLPDRPLLEAAVLVGLVPRGTGLSVLLTRRNDDLRVHAGQVSFPGGRVDPEDADAVAAALRETREEVGIPRALLEPLGFLAPLATITGYRVVPVVVAIDPAYQARPDPREVADVFEVPLAFLLDRANLVPRTIHHAGRERTVWEYAWPSQRIWGATASILLDLAHRLENAE